MAEFAHDSRGYPLTGSYAYASDLGQDSTGGLIDLARSSGVPFTVGSSYRYEIGSWHYSHNAVDIFSSIGNMTKLASYLIQYAPFLGELFFTPPTAHPRPDGRWTGGYYVDNGKVLTSVSASVAIQHGGQNAHVHLAATNSALRAASEKQKALYKQWVAAVNKNGGVPPAAPDTTPNYGTIPGHSTVDPTLGVTTGGQQKRSVLAGCLPKATAVLAVILTVPPLAVILAHHL